jgi:thiosulfate reductase cytochrome b subunit
MGSETVAIGHAVLRWAIPAFFVIFLIVLLVTGEFKWRHSPNVYRRSEKPRQYWAGVALFAGATCLMIWLAASQP